MPPASLSAVPASAMPMTMATLPVMMGGSTLSSAALPIAHDQQADQDLDDRGAEDADLRDPDAVAAVGGRAGR